MLTFNEVLKRLPPDEAQKLRDAAAVLREGQANDPIGLQLAMVEAATMLARLGTKHPDKSPLEIIELARAQIARENDHA